MNSKPEITLNKIRQSPKMAMSFRASDFLTSEEKAERAKKRTTKPHKKRLFDDVDSYVAEIIARFGYEVYLRWNAGEIDQDRMNRLLAAERARERAAWLPIEGFLRGLIQGGVPTFRPKKRPTVGKLMMKIIKEEIKAAKGEA